MDKVKLLIIKIKDNADIILLVLIALGVRLFSIVKYDMWFDEAFTGILMRVPIEEFKNVIAGDTNPPAYYLILKFWTYIMGSTDISLRLFSTLAGVVTVYIVYLIGRRLVNKEAGLIAGFLVAISPFTVGYSLEARSYALYGLVAALSFYLLIRKEYLFFVVVGAFLPLIHYTGIIYLALMVGIYLIQEIRSKNWKQLIPVVAALGLIIFFSYNHSKLKEDAVNASWIKEPSILSIKKSTYAHLFGVTVKKPGSDETLPLKISIDKKYIETGIILAFLALLVSAISLKKVKREDIVPMTSLLMLTFIPMFFAIYLAKNGDTNIYVERYLFPSSIFFMLTIGILLKKLFQFEILMIIVAFYAVGIFTKLEHPKYYTGMRDIVISHKRTVNYMTFTSPMDYVIARYYFGEEYTKLRYYDPKDPTQKYLWWPFMRADEHMAPKKDSLLVVPDANRLDEPSKYMKRRVHGDYIIYSANKTD
jgi:4-amino-4-deoxy-L-arabinose transferase-like glycosyltransferase